MQNKHIKIVVDTNIVASESSFIVSGDKDLLVLEKYNEIKIISVADFFQSFKDKI